MYEVWGQFVEQLSGMWRFRWRALVVAWCLALVGWAWVYTLPNIYSASARVHVDTESALRPLLRGLAVETNIQEQLNFMTRALLSRPQLEKVARETDLDLRAQTPREMEEIIDKLQRKIHIAGDGRSSIYTISYEDTDRALAQAIVQTLLDTFVENSLGSKRTDSSSAQRFLEAQIRDYEQRLAQAEARLADFKKKHVGMMPGEGGDYYERLQSESELLTSLRADLRLAQERRDQLAAQIEGEEAVFGVVQPATSGVLTSQDEKILEFEEQLADLRLRFTDRHPDILALESTIARLKEQREAELKALAGRRGGAAAGLGLNPVYQELRIALTDAELEVTTLRGKVADQERKVSELRRAVDTIPEVEAELKRLNRDYDVTKTQYEELLGRLESARLSEQAEQSNDDVKFQVIDPPVASLQPVAPNRPLFLSMVLVAALGAGAAVAFLQNQLAPVFTSRRRLAELTRVPVLGTVTFVQTPRQRWQERIGMTVFAGGIAALIAAYGLCVVLHEQGVRLARALMTGQLL
jgi:polysaccharide chain length determinant protein (PEP-CTERM system associated)